GAGSRPRVSAVKKLGSERMRTGIGGPMDYESQQALYENNIAGQVRNEVNRRLLTDVAQPASAHVEDSSLAGRDLADELAARTGCRSASSTRAASTLSTSSGTTR